MQFASRYRGGLLASILPGLAWLLALLGTTGDSYMSEKIAVITILTSNTAFHAEDGGNDQAASGAEQARILRALADEIEAGGVEHHSLRDENGNRVGNYQLLYRLPDIDIVTVPIV